MCKNVSVDVRANETCFVKKEYIEYMYVHVLYCGCRWVEETSRAI